MALINGEKILNILRNNNRVIYIPIYQRNYDWTTDDAKKLVSDIWNFREVTKKDDESLYYAGSMIYKKIQDEESVQDKISLVDGQQRITTFLLIIKALGDNPEIPIDDYLFSNARDKKILKISRAKSENILEKILFGNHDNLSDEEKNSNYWKNYLAIKEEIVEKEMDLLKLYHLLSNSVGIAWVQLKKYEDENIVFETINSTGKSLTAGDLIKNYTLSKIHTFSLKNANDLEVIYNNRIEDIFSLKNFKVEDFFRYYVAIKGNGELINKKDQKKIYFAFKEMMKNRKIDRSSYDDIKAILLEILKAALIYQEAINKEIEDVKSYIDLRRNLFKLILRDNMAYFPMYYELINNWTILKDNQLFFNSLEIKEEEILESISKYYFFRRITGRKDKNITRDIVLYFKKYKENEGNETSLKGFEESLSKKESYDQKLPTIEKVIRSLKSITYSKERTLLKHILIAVEIEENKENTLPLNLLKHTLELEHIFPQESKLWKDEFKAENRLEEFYQYEDNKDKIQNIALLSKKRNGEIRNSIFKNKVVSIRKDTTIQMNTIFNKYNEYNNAFLNERMSKIIENFASFYGKELLNVDDYLANGSEIKQIDIIPISTNSNFILENSTLETELQAIEKNVINGEYNDVHSSLRTCLEVILKKNKDDKLFDMISEYENSEEEEIIDAMHDIRKKGNKQTHSLDKDSSKSTAIYALENFHKILKWKSLIKTEFNTDVYLSTPKKFEYKIDSNDQLFSNKEIKIIDPKKNFEEKKLLQKLDVLNHKVNKEDPIFDYVPYRNTPSKAYSTNSIEGFGEKLSKEMLFMYLYEGIGNGSIDRELLPNMKRSRGWVTAATLAYYKINTDGTARKSLKAYLDKEEAIKRIKKFVENN